MTKTSQPKSSATRGKLAETRAKVARKSEELVAKGEKLKKEAGSIARSEGHATGKKSIGGKIATNSDDSAVGRFKSLAPQTKLPPAGRGRHTLLTNDQRRLLARATGGLSPLEFAVSVMRDEAESITARRWAAETLMPYMHHRLPTAIQIHNPQANAGVLVAPAQTSSEEWMAKYGAQPADVVDLEFKEVEVEVAEKPAAAKKRGTTR